MEKQSLGACLDVRLSLHPGLCVFVALQDQLCPGHGDRLDDRCTEPPSPPRTVTHFSCSLVEWQKVGAESGLGSHVLQLPYLKDGEPDVRSRRRRRCVLLRTRHLLACVSVNLQNPPGKEIQSEVSSVVQPTRWGGRT